MKKVWMRGVVVLSLMACNMEDKEGVKPRVDDRSTAGVQSIEERQQEIAEMEREIKAYAKQEKNDMMTAKAERLLVRYRDYISNNPRDSITAEYLFKAADLSLGVGKPNASINYLDRLIKDFPDFRKTVEMMLFKGFIYESYLNQHAEAVKAYQALINRFPNHRLAQDAQSSIDHLTMSEEELIEKFKKLNESEQEKEH
ncbi:MAG: tetratricopeptide repeat protein [Salibacteraceae bacterium]